MFGRFNLFRISSGPALHRTPISWVGVIGACWTLLLRLYGRTWRQELIGIQDLDTRLNRTERVFLCFWHGKYLPLLFLLRGRKACVFTSFSFRGKLLANICRRFGYDCVEIPQNDRPQTQERLRDGMEKHRTCALAVDGPLGPYHVVKRRPVEVASRLGFMIVPVSFASKHSFLLRSRWDRMELPYPFTKVCLVVGRAMSLSPRLTFKETLAKTHEIRKALEDSEQQAKQCFAPEIQNVSSDE